MKRIFCICWLLLSFQFVLFSQSVSEFTFLLTKPQLFNLEMILNNQKNLLKNKILIGGVCFSFGVSVGIISVLLLK